MVSDADVADASLAGSKQLEQTITARELNVASIFADEALIGAIKAANIDVSSLFAAEAFITQLNAVDISGNESLRLTEWRPRGTRRWTPRVRRWLRLP